ncbi:ALP1-like protein [Tanacetum coccineum]
MSEKLMEQYAADQNNKPEATRFSPLVSLLYTTCSSKKTVDNNSIHFSSFPTSWTVFLAEQSPKIDSPFLAVWTVETVETGRDRVGPEKLSQVNSSSVERIRDEVNSEFAVFAEACQAAYEASKPKIHRIPVERDHYGAHDRLVMAYFSENPQYNKKTFRERFRMSRRLFTKIVREVTDASQFFQERYDCTGQRSISALMKCTSAVRQLAYGCVPDSLDEYLQMGATTARDSLRIFCKVIMNLYGEEFLRKPTYTDMEKLYAYHNEKHGFPGMLGSIDCTDWP